MDISSQVEEVLAKYSNLVFDPIKNELEGVISIIGEDLYMVRIELTPYPEYFPVVYETGERIPKKISRHVYSDTGSCCFTTNAKAQILLKTQIKNLVDFVDEIVIPYLWNNSYFELHGRYYDEEYSHGPLGVIEGYRDILQIEDDLQIAKLMYHYVEIGKLNVHDQCYCGSGLPLIKCKQGLHDKLYRAFRKISKDQIKVDLSGYFIDYLKQTGVLDNSHPR